MRRRPAHRKGFFVVFGWRAVAMRDGSAPVLGNCPTCQTETEFVGLVRRRWFTLFFLPVLPLESAGAGQRVCKCRSCKTVFNRPVEQLARGASISGGTDWSHSIALYNKLRENPTDGALMLQLLEVYEAMNEPGEAEAASRHFPTAFNADPRCGAALERMKTAGN